MSAAEQTEQGIFIAAGELPPHIWAKFFLICRAHGLSPKEMIVKMIVLQVLDFEQLNKPVLDQVLNKIGQIIEKRVLYKRT